MNLPRSQRLILPPEAVGQARPSIQNLWKLVESYQNHPEAKSLGQRVNPCDFDTRGLLQRVHIVAGEHIKIGKESDRQECRSRVIDWRIGS